MRPLRAGEGLSISIEMLLSPVGERKDLYIRYETVGEDGIALVPRLGAGSYEISGNTDGKSWTVPVTLPGAAEVNVP